MFAFYGGSLGSGGARAKPRGSHLSPLNYVNTFVRCYRRRAVRSVRARFHYAFNGNRGFARHAVPPFVSRAYVLDRVSSAPASERIGLVPLSLFLLITHRLVPRACRAIAAVSTALHFHFAAVNRLVYATHSRPLRLFRCSVRRAIMPDRRDYAVFTTRREDGRVASSRFSSFRSFAMRGRSSLE